MSSIWSNRLLTISNSEAASTTFPSFNASFALSTCCCISSKHIGGQYDILAEALELEKAFVTTLPLAKIVMVKVTSNRDECLFVKVVLI